MCVVPGNISDQELFISNINKSLINIKYNSDSKKYTRYLLADAIYDTSKIHDYIKRLNIVPIIAPNKRNIKNKKLLAIKKMSKPNKNKYQKRLKVEHTFSYLYKNRRVSKMYEKNITNYMSFLYMATMKIICKFIN